MSQKKATKAFQIFSLDDFNSFIVSSESVNEVNEDNEVNEVNLDNDVVYEIGSNDNNKDNKDNNDNKDNKDKKDFYRLCSDHSKIVTLNNITLQIENNLSKLDKLIEGTRNNYFIKCIRDSFRKNYKILYKAWSSDNIEEFNDIKDITGKEYNKRNRRNNNKPDFSNSLKTQYNVYRKELMILKKIEKFIKEDEHVKEVVLDVIGNVLDDVKEEVEKNGKKYYQNDHYNINEIVMTLGEDKWFLLIEGIANLEMVEERIRKCYENMGWIANEIFV